MVYKGEDGSMTHSLGDGFTVMNQSLKGSDVDVSSLSCNSQEESDRIQADQSSRRPYRKDTMQQIIAIDPGPTESAFVIYDGENIRKFGKKENYVLLSYLQGLKSVGDRPSKLVIEMIASYGMPVGAEVFNTCVWIGRFLQAWDWPRALIYRKEVKMHLCGTMQAKDPNVRQALIDKFGSPGTKKAPGKLYGISGDVWAALAVAVTAIETEKKPLPSRVGG